MHNYLVQSNVRFGRVYQFSTQGGDGFACCNVRVYSASRSVKRSLSNCSYIDNKLFSLTDSLSPSELDIFNIKKYSLLSLFTANVEYEINRATIRIRDVRRG